jgi:hypothetical protein
VLLLLLLQAAEKDELSARAKGDVVAGLLPLVDNFELARTQVKPETEGEQKINNSYQVRPAACPAPVRYSGCLLLVSAAGQQPVGRLERSTHVPCWCLSLNKCCCRC